MGGEQERSLLRQYAAKIGAEELLTPEVEVRARMVTCEAGQTVMEIGEEIHRLQILVEGYLTVYSISEAGKLCIVGHIGPPQMLGDIEYMQGVSSLHSVRAETHAVLLSFPIEDVHQYLSRNIAFYRLMCNNLIDKLYSTSSAYAKNLLYPAKNRFARYLLERVDETGAIHFSAKAASEYLGITARHMSRLITEMEQEGLLCRKKARILQILDREGLTVLTDLF